ncbi:MAG: class I SAM-dependent methyltransferase [bacterium]|nr:class I SAM-dependent methyltransferase [bacterium]
MDNSEIKEPTISEQKAISKLREQIIDRLKNTAESGTEIDYLGKKFFVKRGVFWPRPDSMPLVENFVIKPGENVLDVCTGSGVIAVFAALNGAGKVVAVDINPDAVETAKINAKRFKVEDVFDVRVSDVFSAIKENEYFDVVTCNPPFTDEPSDDDMASRTLRDPGLRVAKDFFKNVGAHLKKEGRIYISQANSGNVHDMLKLADEAGFISKMIGKKEVGENSLEFYAFELRKK